MKLTDFVMLSADAKKAMVLHSGILVAKRQLDDRMVFLFQFDTLYVEVYCNTALRSIEEYQAFTGTRQLAPYLDSIALDDLL